MGVAIPQVLTEDKVSGAQIIDGSLKFDKNKSQRLQFTPSTSGNRRTWTISYWYKNTNFGSTGRQFTAGTSDPDFFMLGYHSLGYIQCTEWNTNWFRTGALLRDTGWYHIVLAWDSTQATNTERWRFYINGVRQNSWTDSGTDLNYPSQNAEQAVNKSSVVHQLGSNTANSQYTDGHLSQVHFIDGQALDPSYFGFTDPLTNTWRPKKFKQTAVESFIFAQLDSDVSSSGTSSITLTNNGSATFVSAGTNSFGVTNAVEFNGSNQWLSFSSAPDQSGRNFSVDFYVKFDTIAAEAYAIDLDGCSFGIRDNSGYKFVIHSENVAGSYAGLKYLSAADTDWHHIRMDGSVANGLWIDGVQQDLSGAYVRTPGNASGTAYIGRGSDGTNYFDGKLAYFRIMPTSIGEPSGSTVQAINNQNYPVTSTNFGLNGFYLPMDGNSPIGQDRSGRGNNWTPVNFGGSNTIEKATGALPILNTDGGGKIGSIGVRTDSNASNLVLALPLNGNSFDVSNRINGGSSTKTITVNGNAATSRAQSNFYGGSFYFDGSGDYLVTTSDDFRFGTNDFTVEAFIHPTTLDTSGMSSGVAPFIDYMDDTSDSGGAWFSLQQSNTGLRYASNGSARITTSSGLTIGWHHVAVVRSSNTTTLYLDGVSQGSFSDTHNYTDAFTRRLYVGKQNYLTRLFTGYIQDVRIYKGVAKYTQNFIPASTDPDILPDTPSGVAYSSKLQAVQPSSTYGGSLVFDGSGDYLRFSQSSDWAFGTGDFSIEYFIFPNHTAETLGFGGTRGAAGTASGWNIGLINQDTNGGYIQMYSDGGIAPTSNYQKIPYGQWTHVVYTRSSGTIRAIINGVLYNNAANTQNWTLNDFSIGITGAGQAEPYLGYLSNIRIIKGSIPTSYQTSSTTAGTRIFNVPTSPLSTTSQGATSGDVKFLGCNSITSITDFTVTPNTPTVNGQVAVSYFNPFVNDTNINTVRGQESGYCTWNPLSNGGSAPTNGNLTLPSNGGVFIRCNGTQAVSSGKWYFELTLATVGTVTAVGVARDYITNKFPGEDANSYNRDLENGNTLTNNSSIGYAPTMTTGDVFCCALDLDNNKLWFGKNGVFTNPNGSTGVPSSGTNPTFNIAAGTYTPIARVYASGQLDANFGQKPFKFPPPAGFQPLALANTPRPTIVRPDQYVGVSTYSGQTAAQSITTGFKPDLVWIKRRNSAENNLLFDSIRGPLNRLISNATNAELSLANSLTSFNSNGFSLGSGESAVNADTYTYVAWAWKAGGNSNTYNINDIGYSTASAAGLDGGTITPTGASVNTTSGFSIIKFDSGASGTKTLSHGLSKTPQFILVKTTGSTSDWSVYHKDLGGVNNYLVLNTTAANGTVSNIWGTSVPDTSVFGINSGQTCATNQSVIAYLWAEIPGFSKFGSYIGTGVSPNYVHLGFRPALVIIKNVGTNGSPSTTNNWLIQDSTRNKYNQINDTLYPNTSAQEANSSSNFGVDFLSNGFALRTTGGYLTNSNNASEGHTIIYAAWAEAPSFNLYGAQSNAR